MSENTKIEWATHTWNPWYGCTKVSPGCAHCYAESLMDTRFKRVKWGPGNPRVMNKDWSKPRAWEKRASRPVIMNFSQCDDAGNPACFYDRPRIFPSLCDWLDPEVPVAWLAEFLDLVRTTPHLDWLLLTKRPGLWYDRIRSSIDNYVNHPSIQIRFPLLGPWMNSWTSDRQFPPNVWIGTSVEDQDRADERIPAMLRIPAAKRFVSAEPLLGPINLPLEGIDWLIIGGESGPKARPCHLDWVRGLIAQCQDARVPVFVKQIGAFPITSGLYLPWLIRNRKGSEPTEWPHDLRVREFPL